MNVRRLQDLVTMARREFMRNPQARPQPSRTLLSSKESLLKEGMRLVATQRWAEAYTVLARAQRLDMMDPLSMAYFGWSQYHHKGLDPEDRVREGTSHINLAYQFDNSHPDICYFFAVLLMEHKRVDALQHCIDMRRKFPDDERFVKLQETLQASLR